MFNPTPTHSKHYSVPSAAVLALHVAFHHVHSMPPRFICILHYTTNAVLRSDRIEFLTILIPGPSYIAARLGPSRRTCFLKITMLHYRINTELNFHPYEWPWDSGFETDGRS